MNERIKELAEQAGFYYTDKTGFITPAGCDPAKFAELIVKECIEVIDNTSDNTKLMRVDPYQKIIWAIEEHFGVEE
jgi:hypothetical protein